MAKKEISIVPYETLISKIYLIRGHKVMLDKDLAELYQVTTGNLNKSVQRNLKRFPDDFMFQLNQEEFKNLIFQIGTSSWGGTISPHTTIHSKAPFPCCVALYHEADPEATKRQASFYRYFTGRRR